MTAARAKRLLLVLLAGTAVALLAIECLQLRSHIVSLLARAGWAQQFASGDVGAVASSESLMLLREQVDGARRDLEAIRADTHALLWLAKRLGWLPWVGPVLATAPAALDTVVHLCDAAWWSLLAMEPVTDAMSKAVPQMGETALESALPVLALSKPRLIEAEQAIAQARASWRQVDQRGLPLRLAGWAARLDRALPLLEAAVRIAHSAPALLGQERPVTYLLLAQNNQELRATGGFISGCGILQLSAGRIVTATFQDSYAVDAGCSPADLPPPPAPLRRYVWAPVLVFRDANWSPDFASSAAVLRSIYRQCQGDDVDGVIAIDLEAVAMLLEAVGPLQPEGYPSPVTCENLFEFAGEYWAAPLRSATIAQKDDSNWWSHRKDFMADLLQAALQKVETSPQSTLSKLARPLWQALTQKHLLVCLNKNHAASATFAAMGWDGALTNAQGDSLMVVDSNVGFRKVNPNIRQSVEYQVDLRIDGQAHATLILHYQNASNGEPDCTAGSSYDDSYEQMMQGCYWDYVRVYAPAGSQLLTLDGVDSTPEVSQEARRSVFSALLVVPPGQSRDVSLSYELPPAVLQDVPQPSYRLLIQKQPGAAGYPVNVRVLGSGWMLDPGQARPGDGGRGADLMLDSDVELVWVRTGADGNAMVRWRGVLTLVGSVMLLAGVTVWRQARTS